MYTQCPECGTVFRLSADTLRVAQGDVRCGICSNVFNALEALSDSPNSHLAHSPPPEDTMTVEEVTGTEIIELGVHGERVSHGSHTFDEVAWPQDAAAAATAAPTASDALLLDDQSAAEEPNAIEVSIADDEVTKMLEASGTWERLHRDFKALAAPTVSTAPAPEAAPPTAAEAMAESVAESMAAEPAGQPSDGQRASIRAFVAASEQITLESPGDATAAVTGAPAAEAPLLPMSVPGAATASDGLGGEFEVELADDAGTDLAWEDDLDEAAAARREHEIEVLAEAIATGRNPVLAVPPTVMPASLEEPPAPSAAVEPPTIEPEVAATETEAPTAASAPPDEPALPMEVPPPLDLDLIWRQAPEPLPLAMARAGRQVDLDATDEFPILVLDERDDVEPELALEPAPAPSFAFEIESEPEPEPEPDSGTGIIVEETPAAIFEPEPAAAEPPAPVAGDAAATESLQIRIPPELRRWEEPSAAERAAQVFAEATTAGARPRRWPWVAATLLLAGCLGVQVIHFNRERLAADPQFGPWLARAYALFGLKLEAPTDLAAFELRHWGAASDAIARDRLRFRASIVNRARHAQRYPLLRLSLQDRFGNLVGIRDALPKEYLRGVSPTTTMMLPGQRVDAELIVVDPGDAAVGFELELCVPAGSGVRCAKDADAP